jgi:nitrogenase molybdenum-iron protein alpha chain
LPRQKDLVNVTNMFSYTWMDKIELSRLLNKLGLRVNFVPEFATVEELEIMGSAAVTAPVCPTFADYLMRGLEEHFGVPYFKDPLCDWNHALSGNGPWVDAKGGDCYRRAGRS